MQDLLEPLWLLPPVWQWLISAVLAGMWASFLNMAIWRIPRGESIVWPGSHCPICNHSLGLRDLIPIFSYLLLRGRCGYCLTRFGPRYFLIELCLVSLVSLYYYILGWSRPFVGVCLITWLIMLISGILLQRRIDAGILKLKQGSGGFTFIEIMLTMIIVAAVIIPFGNIFISSYGRAIKNKDYFMGWNLVESKLEELKLVPFNKLESDYDLYIKTDRKDDNIFVDERLSVYSEMREDEEIFYQKFSDVYTTENQLPEVPHKKFVRAYEKQYGLPFEFHSRDYRYLRRVVKVEPVKIERNPKFFNKDEYGELPPSLVKVTVIVTIDSPTLNRKLEASIYRAR